MRYNTLEEGMNLTVYSNDEASLVLSQDDGSLYRFRHDSEVNADLLQSLKELLPAWESGIEEPWITRARDAIAKAEGGEV